MARKRLDPIPPGEILREEFMGPLGISVSAFARDIAVPANRISQILNGKRALSADTAPARQVLRGVGGDLGRSAGRL
jgi:addiction module HigA family antidote